MISDREIVIRRSGDTSPVVLQISIFGTADGYYGRMQATMPTSGRIAYTDAAETPAQAEDEALSMARDYAMRASEWALCSDGDRSAAQRIIDFCGAGKQMSMLDLMAG